jgi:uncharacterized lipoprotein YddW (UPF0748 family)
MKAVWKKAVVITFAAALLATSFGVTGHGSADAAKDGFYRAFWVQAFEEGLKTADEIDQLVIDVKRANMNAIVAQVSRRHDAYYNSDVLPFTQDPAVPEGFDPLGYLLKKAHAEGIEVHAWVVIGPMWHPIYGGEPDDPDHIWNKFGPDAPDEETWVTKGYDGSVPNRMQPYLDPGHPDARDHVVAMVTDIVKNYDVDGVHLDYIRYPENPGGRPAGWNGYNPTAVERFLTETGRSDVPEPKDEEWLAWKVEQVDSLVKRVYLEMLDVDRQAHMTAAFLSWGFDDPRSTDWWQMPPVQRAHQNWKRWVQEGYLDYTFVMNYDPEANPQRAERFDWWIEWQKDLERNRGMVIGPALYLNSIEDSIAQINRALAPSPNGNTAEGISPYVYNVWSNDDSPQEDLIRSLSEPTEYNDGKPPFDKPVNVPQSEWKKADHGHVLGQLLKDGEPVAGEQIALKRGKNGRVVTEAVSDANGYFGVTDLRPGSYYVEFEGKTNERVQVKVQQVSRVQVKR